MSLDWLDSELTTTAYGWRLDRQDGVTLAFTSHDRDIIIDNLRYRAAPGMVPSSISLSDSLDIDSVEIEGILTASAISEHDLAAGRWNGASLQISLLDWEDPTQEQLHLLTGEFGEITQFGDAFRAEILGPTSFLDEAVVPVTSPTCRARFGDRHCKISLHRHQREAALTAINDLELAFDSLAGSGSSFAFGELRWLDGSNIGLSAFIISGAGDTIRLAEHPARPLAIGDRAQLTAGCDKNFATCRDRFGNGVNFRGEPYLPGNDLLTRYPGS